MGVEPAPLAITDGVDRLFCSRSSARYGPYKRQDEGSVIAPGVLYRYRVLNEADRPLALQLFTGLGRLGGPLWERSRSGGRRVRLKDSLLLQGKLRAWRVTRLIWSWRLALTP